MDERDGSGGDGDEAGHGVLIRWLQRLDRDAMVQVDGMEGTEPSVDCNYY